MEAVPVEKFIRECFNNTERSICCKQRGSEREPPPCPYSVNETFSPFYHSPITLQGGSWKKSKSYFKFENWWLGTEGFIDRVRTWWNSFDYTRRPDYILASKPKIALALLPGTTLECDWRVFNVTN
ncbi:hypothetical protein H5410_017715 [Solanum commersonii]|uniref:Uncharacterized protein n=1 Tax=Solanum commersonii TaxID=4109 RepID=A0A9J6A0S6_SOLCO|nr:hypothetical protein H5410_017715 [Solanum commersonii]